MAIDPNCIRVVTSDLDMMIIGFLEDRNKPVALGIQNSIGSGRRLKRVLENDLIDA